MRTEQGEKRDPNLKLFIARSEGETKQQSSNPADFVLDVLQYAFQQATESKRDALRIAEGILDFDASIRKKRFELEKVLILGKLAGNDVSIEEACAAVMKWSIDRTIRHGEIQKFSVVNGVTGRSAEIILKGLGLIRTNETLEQFSKSGRWIHHRDINMGGTTLGIRGDGTFGHYLNTSIPDLLIGSRCELDKPIYASTYSIHGYFNEPLMQNVLTHPFIGR